MRILHVIANLDPASGGPLMVATRLAAAQVGLGHEVHLLTYGLPAKEREVRANLASLPHGTDVRIHELRPAGHVERVFALRARRAVREMLARIDVVHLHGIWDPILKAVAHEAHRARRRLGRDIPCVVAPHGMLTPWALSEKRLKKRIAFRLGWSAMVHRAACVHALSRYEHECVHTWGFLGRIDELPNGVFLSEIDPLPSKGAFRARVDGLGDNPFILFLARLHAVKGLDLLVEAFAAIRGAHPRLHLVIVGPDYGAGADLRARVARLGIGPYVHIVGPFYGPDRFTAMVDCACFCLPSRHEGFSMSIVEALACSVPVVITEECHFPEVRETGAGMVVARSVSALSEALDCLLQSPESALEMGRRGRRLVESSYTWPRIAQRAIEVYRAVAAGPREVGQRPPTWSDTSPPEPRSPVE